MHLVFPTKPYVNLNASAKAYVFQCLMLLPAAGSVRKRTYRTQNRTASLPLSFSVYLNSLLTIDIDYSVLKLLTGLAIAALIAWKLTVNKVISNAPPIATAKIHQLISARYSYFCNHSWR